MLNSIDVAKYFISKDSERILFNKNLIQRNNRNFYEGNARLNKYLHIAQNLYIAKTGDKLFKENLYAYDNGAVVPDIQKNYSLLLTKNDDIDLDDDISEFLDKVYVFLQNADIDELIEISHEDSEWQEKHRYFDKQQQKMDSLSHAEEYASQYADALKVMDGMTV